MQNHNKQKLYTNLYFRNNESVYCGQSLLMIPQFENLWGDEKGFTTTNTIHTWSVFSSSPMNIGPLYYKHLLVHSLLRCRWSYSYIQHYSATCNPTPTYSTTVQPFCVCVCVCVCVCARASNYIIYQWLFWWTYTNIRRLVIIQLTVYWG